MSDKPDKPKRPARPWGHMEDGKFVEVPWIPLVNAGFVPPGEVTVYSGTRLIIEKPHDDPE